VETKNKHIRYSDDTTLLAENKENTVVVIKSVKSKSERAGLNFNLKKMGVMSTVEQVNILADSKEISTVTH
jgi:hypothetical protein